MGKQHQRVCFADFLFIEYERRRFALKVEKIGSENYILGHHRGYGVIAGAGWPGIFDTGTEHGILID